MFEMNFKLDILIICFNIMNFNIKFYKFSDASEKIKIFYETFS